MEGADEPLHKDRRHADEKTRFMRECVAVKHQLIAWIIILFLQTNCLDAVELIRDLDGLLRSFTFNLLATAMRWHIASSTGRA
jgi:hypothetical protein